MEKYNSYEILSQNEVEGRDYRIRTASGTTGIAVIAPHGGGIEPGTTEIAEAIAADGHDFYTFSGIKPTGNGVLHITSRKFNEPRGLAIAAQAHTLLTIHGCMEKEKSIFMGGRDKKLVLTITKELIKAGFNAKESSRFPATNPLNICNRNTRGMGIQLEISMGLRRDMFKQITRLFRKETTPVFQCFVNAIQKCLCT